MVSFLCVSIPLPTPEVYSIAADHPFEPRLSAVELQTLGQQLHCVSGAGSNVSSPLKRFEIHGSQKNEKNG